MFPIVRPQSQLTTACLCKLRPTSGSCPLHPFHANLQGAFIFLQSWQQSFNVTKVREVDEPSLLFRYLSHIVSTVCTHSVREKECSRCTSSIIRTPAKETHRPDAAAVRRYKVDAPLPAAPSLASASGLRYHRPVSSGRSLRRSWVTVRSLSHLIVYCWYRGMCLWKHFR